MKIKYRIILILLIRINSNLHAQHNSVEDSLLLLARRHQPSTEERFSTLVALADFQLSQAGDSALLNRTGKTLTLLEQEAPGSDARSSALITRIKAKYLLRRGDFKSALTGFSDAIKLFEAAGDQYWTGVCAWNFIAISRQIEQVPANELYFYRTIIQNKDALIQGNKADLVSKTYHFWGDYYYKRNIQLDSSRYYFQQAIRIGHQHQVEHFQSHVVLAYVLKDHFCFREAILTTEELITESKVQKNLETEFWAWQTLGTIYSTLKNKSKIAHTFREAERVALQMNSLKEIFISKSQSYLNRYQENPEKYALDTLLQLYQTAVTQYEYDLYLLNGLEGHLIYAHRFDEAHRIYDDRIRRSQKYKDNFHLIEAMLGKAELLLTEGRYNLAAQMARSAYHLCKDYQQHQLLHQTEWLLSRTEAAVGNIQSANKFYQKASLFRDSVETAKLLAVEQLSLSLERYRTTADSLQLVNQIVMEKQETTQTRNFLTGLVAFALLVILALGLERRFLLRKANKFSLSLNQKFQNLQQIIIRHAQDKAPSAPAGSPELELLMQINRLDNELSQLINNDNNTIEQRIEIFQQMAHLQQTLQDEMEKRIKNKSEDLRTFNRAIGHDLKMPLNNAHNLANLLSMRFEDSQDAESLRYVHAFKDIVKEIRAMIDGLNTYSNSEDLDIQKSDFNLKPLVASVIGQYQMNSPEYNQVKIKQEGLDRMIQSDPFFLRLILNNLLSNALKFSVFEPRPTVIIRARSEPAVLRIEIEDNGIGLPSNIKSEEAFKLFRKFYHNQTFEGTGVGLAIVKRLTERLGGTIELMPAPEKGVLARLEFST